MRSITGDARRATQDMDLDFIRYSLRDDSIRNFISRLNCLDGVSIQITGEIEELSQQEYHGKRVFITITDETGYSLRSKIDLGVHKQVQIEQDEYCFDVCMDGQRLMAEATSLQLSGSADEGRAFSYLCYKQAC